MPAGSEFAGRPVPTPPLADDDGSTSGELSAHLAGLAAGTSTGDQVLAALAGARLLIPVVAVREDSEVNAEGLHQEKSSSMATVLVASDSGGRALLAFSGSAALVLWRPDARPVPIAASLAARAAIDEGADTLLIDISGPMPFAVAGRELLLVAALTRAEAGTYEDPVLLQALRQHVMRQPHVKGASLAAGELRRYATGDDGAGSPTPGVLRLVATGDDRSWLADFVDQLAKDRVIALLLPEGLRVRVVVDDGVVDGKDTPTTAVSRSGTGR